MCLRKKIYLALAINEDKSLCLLQKFGLGEA